MSRPKPKEGEQNWTVITVPDRRLAASIIAFGVVFGRHRLEGGLSGGTSRIEGLEAGTPIKWLNSHGEAVFGRLVKIESGNVYYKQRVHGGWGLLTHRPLEMASSFSPCNDEDEFVDPRPLTGWPNFVAKAVGGDVTEFLSTSRIDVLLLGRKSELQADLEDPGFPAGVSEGPLAAVVRPKCLVPRGEYHRSELLSGVSDPDDVDQVQAPVTVVDGAQAYIRLKDTLRSPVVVVVLDRWLPSSDDAAVAAMIDRQFGWVDNEAPSIAFPDGIELFRWTAAL